MPTRERHVDAVPWWIGPLALPIVFVGTVVGVGVYALWCYRRGQLDGAGLAADRPPYSHFGWRVGIWAALLVASMTVFIGATRLWILMLPFPIVTLAICFHVTTLCYKQGMRLGAVKVSVSDGFTSPASLSLAISSVFVVMFPILAVATSVI